MKNKLLILSLIIFGTTFSCQDIEVVEDFTVKPNKYNQSLRTSSKDNPENKDEIIEYLRENGFEIDLDSKITKNVKDKHKVKTLDEAKKIIQAIKKFENHSAIISFSKKQSKNERPNIPNCDEEGAYYIDNAINAYVTGVDIRFERGPGGTLSNISSYATGFTFGWGWNQIGVWTFGSTNHFCIDGTMTYGIDIDGVTFGYSSSVAIDVRLNGCTAVVSQRYGHC
jgi:hypothetical protein